MSNKCEPSHKNLGPINKLLVVVLVIKDLILLIDVSLSKKVDDKNGAFSSYAKITLPLLSKGFYSFTQYATLDSFSNHNFKYTYLRSRMFN